jgi:hypothetical protein
MPGFHEIFLPEIPHAFTVSHPYCIRSPLQSPCSSHAILHILRELYKLHELNIDVMIPN